MVKTVLNGKRVLLIVTGGIAAYKCPELVRRLRERGFAVRCVMTEAAKQFVTPLALGAVSEDRVYDELFSLTDEHEMGHIQLSRDADVLLVAPATGNILAKMAHGEAGDLATTVLLATDKPVMAAPAMNVRMWEHAATQANVATLTQRGVSFIGPEEGDMACGEYGMGRMSEPTDIADAVEAFFARDLPLAGKRALVTSGPTYEPIDPVRYIANRSSGKQGHAIATALAALGAEVTLVSGPTRLSDPAGVRTVHVESAAEMLAACENALPADVAVCAAAVCDWRVAAEARLVHGPRHAEATDRDGRARDDLIRTQPDREDGEDRGDEQSRGRARDDTEPRRLEGERTEGTPERAGDNRSLQADVDDPAALRHGLTHGCERQRDAEPDRGLEEENELDLAHEPASSAAAANRAARTRSSPSTARMTSASTTSTHAAGMPASRCMAPAPA